MCNTWGGESLRKELKIQEAALSPTCTQSYDIRGESAGEKVALETRKLLVMCWLRSHSAPPPMCRMSHEQYGGSDMTQVMREW